MTGDEFYSIRTTEQKKIVNRVLASYVWIKITTTIFQFLTFKTNVFICLISVIDQKILDLGMVSESLKPLKTLSLRKENI